MAHDDLFHHCKVIALVNGFDFEPAVTGTIRLAVTHDHHAGDGEFAQNVGYVKSDDVSRGDGQSQLFFQSLDRRHARICARKFRIFKLAVLSAENSFKVCRYIPVTGGFFKIHFRRKGFHLFRQFFLQRGYISIEDGKCGIEPFAVLFCVDFSDTGGAAVVDDAFETVLARILIRLGIPAGAQTEAGQQILQRKFQRRSLREGSSLDRRRGERGIHRHIL